MQFSLRQVGGSAVISLSKYEIVLEQRLHHAAASNVVGLVQHAGQYFDSEETFATFDSPYSGGG